MRTITLALILFLPLAFIAVDSAATASDTDPVPAQLGGKKKKKKSKKELCIDKCISDGDICKKTCETTHKDPRGISYCKESCSNKVRNCKDDCGKSKK